MESVQLHGTWYSPCPYRVIWALKMKGVGFEYIEEDLLNKSSVLLKYNPVHKKIPVLVHNGRPICESMLIVEYIDEMWPDSPLLPTEPLNRANARFWAKYLEDKSPVFMKLLSSTGEELHNAAEEIVQIFQTIEECALGDQKFFGGDDMGYLDIALGLIGRWYGVFEEVSGTKILFASGKLHRLQGWIKRLEEHPIVEQNLPDRDNMLSFFKMRRDMAITPRTS